MLMAEAQLRAETAAERYRIEAREWAARFQSLHREHEEEPDRLARGVRGAARDAAPGGGRRRRRGGRAPARRAQGHAALPARRRARAARSTGCAAGA